MRTFTVNMDQAEPTIETSAVVTEQQGSWKWQVRLCRAYYVAVWSPYVKAWIWKSVRHSASFSGGNWRSGSRAHVDGSLDRRRLDGPALAALAVVRGENWDAVEVPRTVEPCIDCGDPRGDGHADCPAWTDGPGTAAGGSNWLSVNGGAN